MNENKIIETLKYISQFVENRHDEGLGDYLHIVIGRADINVIDETIYLLERKQKEIVRYKKEIEEKTTILMAGAEKVKRLESQIEELLNVLNNEKKINYIKPIDIKVQNYISKDQIKELIKKYQEKAEDVKQKYRGGYAYISDYLEALAKIEGYQELLEEK